MKKRDVLTLLLACSLIMSENGMPVLAAEPEQEISVTKQQEEEKTLTDTQEKENKASESVSGNDVVPAEEDYVNRVVSFTDYTGMRVTYDANVSRKYVYEVTDGVLMAVREKRSGGEALTPVVFEGNVELKQPEEGEKYTAVSASVFGGNQEITYVKLPAGVTRIAEAGFQGCTALKSVYLPSTLQEIGAGAFENCTAMTQISLPKSVSAIGEGAFKGDTKLQLLQMRDREECGLASVGAYAFADCMSLDQVVLPRTVVTVGDHAFGGCTGLTRVEVDCDQIVIGQGAFPGAAEAAQMVIVSQSGSNAEAYAKENGLTFQEDRTR